MKLLLKIICVALLVLFAYQVMSYPLEQNISQNKTIDNELSKSVDYQLPELAVLNGIDAYSEIVQRPLFAKDRAAIASAQKVNKVTTVNELAHLILVGTASSSDVQIAIVADTKAKQMERLKVGESYNDWDISEVSTDHVVFQSDELEYKLFVTPIQGSQKAKQAKLISQLNKSKIERTSAAIRSSQNLDDNDNEVPVKSKRSISERSWGYNKKYKSNNTSVNNTQTHSTAAQDTAVKRSPIKIPDEEERDDEYYEGLSDDYEAKAYIDDDRLVDSKEITADDFYGDEEFSQDELKLLEDLGARLFDN